MVEPDAGNDKRAVAGQPFGRASFKVTGLDNPLKEQLDGLPALGVEIPFPGLRSGRELLGSKQPPLLRPIGGNEVSAAKGRISQQRLSNGELVSSQGLARIVPAPTALGHQGAKSGTGAGKTKPCKTKR